MITSINQITSLSLSIYIKLVILHENKTYSINFHSYYNNLEKYILAIYN